MTPTKKEKLKRILKVLQTDDEKLADNLLGKMEEMKESLISLSEDNKLTKNKLDSELTKVMISLDKNKKMSSKMSSRTSESFIELVDKLVNKLDELKRELRPKDIISKDYSLDYKKMLEKLSGIDNKVGGWKFPQYAYSGIRNKSFSPINPARQEDISNMVSNTTSSPSTNLSIFNVEILVANTEYSQLLPTNTKKFKIYAMNGPKTRPHSDVIYYSNVVGGSGSSPIPIPAFGFDGDEGLNLTNTTLYFQSPTSSASVIIRCWV